MPSSRILIASNTLSSSATSVTFSSIPATYTDLVLRITSRETAALGYIQLRFNGLSTTLYSRTFLTGDGSAAASSNSSGADGILAIYDEDSGYTASTFNSMEIYIPSYTASQNKPLSIYGVSETNAATAKMAATAALWRSTAAISSISLSKVSATYNFVSGSSFFLYGIKNS